MSRFSKADAEKAGWTIVHEEPEARVLFSGGEQGVTKALPPSYRAEKMLSQPGKTSQIVSEEASSMGLLLERIHAYEQHLASIELPESPAPSLDEVEEIKLEEVGESKNPFIATGNLAPSIQGSPEQHAEASRVEEDAKDSSPKTDPEGEAGPQVFPGEASPEPEAEEKPKKKPKKKAKKRAPRRKKAK